MPHLPRLPLARARTRCPVRPRRLPTLPLVCRSSRRQKHKPATNKKTKKSHDTGERPLHKGKDGRYKASQG
eukprot:12107836-Alexandrium_andersonii.AAC.1